uniref:Tape measure protein n=1 Tax=Stenotrophomonas phage vB_SmaS_QH3 TaxID=3229738 RepID=A0AAU7YTJ5_9CAUD
MAENIEIKVQDSVAPSVSNKLRAIAKDARDADGAVKSLQSSLKGISASSGLQRLQTELAKTALQQQKLLTETNKTNAAYFAAEAALNRAIAAEQRAATATAQLTAAQTKAATEAQRLATAQQQTAAAVTQAQTAQAQLATAQTNTATAAQRLAQAQQQTTAATANAAAAQTRAATAATQGQTATQNLAAATTRATTAQTQGATAAQRLATEQQRTATQTANAAAANDRAALAALRLAQAQQRAGQASQTAGQQIAGYVKAAAGIAGVTLSASAILASADAYTTLQNKLQNVTESQAQVNTLTNELFELANKTRAGVEETATAFTRFDRALKFMGKSQEDSLRLTETINKALIVSGATAQEASSALLQLSQGFNAGKLQGDEFRAVSENMPMVLDAVAKALNVPINRVKELSSEGKITSEVLFNAFALIQKSVDDTFNKTTPTIGQSLTVLKNNAIQFFGELNKATGVTAALSKGILWLADNLKIVAVVLAGVGTAMLLAFGPQIVAAVVSATTAVKAFTVALASNPIGLIAVALATVIAYLTLFRDEINLGIDDVTTLGDFFRATFEGIGQVIDDVKLVVGQLWADMTEGASGALAEVSAFVGDSVSGWIEDYTSFFQTERTGWAAALENTAKVLDAIAGLITGLATFAGRAMAEIVIQIQNAIADAYNFIVGYIEKVTNLAIEAANKLRAMVGKAGYELVNFERMGDAGSREFEGFGKLWAESLEDGFKSQGGAMQSMVNGLFDRAQAIGAARRAGANSTLRGSGASQLSEATDKNAAKAAERRALAMEKINTQLDNELNRMFQLQPQREAQAKFDQIEESLIQKKIKLNDDEKASIMAKIKAIQDATEVQKQFDAIYQEATAPAKEYNATQEAANKLLAMGAISQEQYSRAILKSSEAYANSQDPMRQYNKDLQQQFDLLNMLPKQREIEQQVMQVQNDLLTKGITLNAQELQQLREKLTLLQQLNAVSQQEAALLDASVNKRQQQADQLTAINKLLADQSSGFTKSDALTALGNTDAGAYLAGSPEMVNAQVEQYGTLYAQIDAMRQADLISEQTASAAKLQIWNAQQNAQLNTAKTFFGSLEGLQNSSNSKMARIGKAAAIANAIINTYQSATGAYASLASIPYVGPALGAAAAAAAIAAGMANVAAIRSQNTGFMQGGYTGNMARDEVAGVVHGREFVMDAESTSRIGVANLEALRNGAANVRQNSASATPAPVSGAGGGSTDVAGGAGTTVNMRNINVLDPALVGEYLATPDGEQVFINTMRRNSDQVRQIIQNG